MDDVTFKALNGSIKKWEKIVTGEEVDKGGYNCPLCQMTRNDENCERCPVYQSGDDDMRDECGFTPYTDWGVHHDSKHGIGLPRKLLCDTCRKIAQKELDFLKSLLPKEGTKVVHTSGRVEYVGAGKDPHRDFND